ncbi:MAG: hypothetical protein JXR82_01025 [Marinifilaceae bacterium]|nr:hypothetical protein [Marinifilaceae bacterium]
MRIDIGNIVLVFILLFGINFKFCNAKNIDTDLIRMNSLPTDTIKPIQIFNVELTTQLDSKIGIGGFDSTIDFDSQLVSEVCNRIDAIANICQQLAKDNHLEILKWEVKKNSVPSRLYFQFRAKELNGIFEVTYRVNNKIGRAQCSFWFYSNTGFQESPDFDKYKGLTEILLDAMQCTN